MQPLLARLRQATLSQADGELCAALVSRHFSEARGLINCNRKLATLWNRSHGPLLLQQTLEQLQYPLIKRPPSLDDSQQSDRVMRFITALGRYGSTALQQDIERYAPRLLQLIQRPLASGLPDTLDQPRH